MKNFDVITVVILNNGCARIHFVGGKAADEIIRTESKEVGYAFIHACRNNKAFEEDWYAKNNEDVYVFSYKGAR